MVVACTAGTGAAAAAAVVAAVIPVPSADQVVATFLFLETSIKNR